MKCKLLELAAGDPTPSGSWTGHLAPRMDEAFPWKSLGAASGMPTARPTGYVAFSTDLTERQRQRSRCAAPSGWPRSGRWRPASPMKSTTPWAPSACMPRWPCAARTFPSAARCWTTPWPRSSRRRCVAGRLSAACCSSPAGGDGAMAGRFGQRGPPRPRRSAETGQSAAGFRLDFLLRRSRDADGQPRGNGANSRQPYHQRDSCLRAERLGQCRARRQMRKRSG